MKHNNAPAQPAANIGIQALREPAPGVAMSVQIGSLAMQWIIPADQVEQLCMELRKARLEAESSIVLATSGPRGIVQ